MTFDELWKQKWVNRRDDPGADRPFAQAIWNAAKKDVWATVFQLVSNRPDFCTHQFIKMLELERGKDGAGPK